MKKYETFNSKTNNVIITSYHYNHHTNIIPEDVYDFVNELKEKYEWLTISQIDHTTQGILKINNINVGVNIANEIYNKYKYTVTVVNVGEIEINDIKSSKGLIENNEYINTLIEKKEIGIFYKSLL